MPKCPFCGVRPDTGAELQEHITIKHPEEVTDVGGRRLQQPKKFKRKEKSPPVVVDGNNLAYANGNDPEINNIKKARAVIKKQGYEPIIFVSAALRHDIDNAMELNRLINLTWIIEVEGGQDDDVFIIEEAQRKKCNIISNDQFKEYYGDYDLKDWKIKDALIQFSFVDGKFELHK